MRPFTWLIEQRQSRLRRRRYRIAKRIESADIIIVVGPSCAGKTTFIQGYRDHFNPRNRTIKLARQLEIEPSPEFPLIVHYSSLRCLDLTGGNGSATSFGESERRDYACNFDSDIVWSRLRAHSDKCHVILMVVEQETLIKRAMNRSQPEPLLAGAAHRNGSAYRRQFHLNIYRRLDLDAHYGQWRGEIERNGIPITSYDGNVGAFKD